MKRPPDGGRSSLLDLELSAVGADQLTVAAIFRFVVVPLGATVVMVTKPVPGVVLAARSAT
jgi:hypothetical protein